MFNFLRRKVALTDYLRHEKKIQINRVEFAIRRVNVEDHLAGLKVILKLHDLYKRENKRPSTAEAEDLEKVRKFARDFIFAGVVSPKLTMKKEGEAGAIHVDEILADFDLSQRLCTAIIEHSYGKKNFKSPG